MAFPFKLSIIIVNYNSLHHLERCVESILNSDPFGDFEVIIYDNNSTDLPPGCDPYLKFKNFTWIHGNENIGFARANNIAADHSKGKYLLFLNPDTYFKPDLLSRFVHMMDTLPDFVAMGVQLVNTDGSPQHSGARFVWGGFNNVLSLQGLGPIARQLAIALHVPDHNKTSPNFLQPIDWICGAFLCVRRGAFMLSGQFDPAFFLYFEEFVLCHQLRKYGKLALVQGLKCTHVGGGSTPKHNIAQHHVSCLYSIKVRYGRLLVLANYLLFIIECFVLPLAFLWSKNVRTNYTSTLAGFYRCFATVTRTLPTILFTGKNQIIASP
jgi:GT2 family glycosyltransferase